MENNMKENQNEVKQNQTKQILKSLKIFVKEKVNLYSTLIVAVIIAFVCIFSVSISGGFYTQTTVEASMSTVRIVQARLSEMGYYNDKIDGVLDSYTKNALKEFQKDNNLLETGELNQATQTALGVSNSEQTNNELYLLAKLIYSEARGEIYAGQVAVGAVVLNRVDDAGFPNTLQGVIYQPWAFTALNDGQFALEPNATAYQAAQDAFNGWDPSYGSLYYYNPTTATSAWIFTRTTVVVIGNHVFAI